MIDIDRRHVVLLFEYSIHELLRFNLCFLHFLLLVLVPSAIHILLP